MCTWDDDIDIIGIRHTIECMMCFNYVYITVQFFFNHTIGCTWRLCQLLSDANNFLGASLVYNIGAVQLHVVLDF